MRVAGIHIEPDKTHTQFVKQDENTDLLWGSRPGLNMDLRLNIPVGKKEKQKLTGAVVCSVLRPTRRAADGF